VGPLARLNLNHHLLPPEVHDILKEGNITFPTQNMFHSVIARSVEIYYAMLEAIRIMESYVYTTTPHIPMTPRAGVGFGCTEAPRGLLWHRYEFNDEGLVASSRIVPPTSQNQARIEEDLWHSLMAFGLDHSDDDLRFHSEMVIRNYDPCISCSTHFLQLKVDRT
jgi:coenzyme F420-reducing hydrogenase alpha subunit